MASIKFFELNESEVINNTKLTSGSFICCKDSTNMYMVPTTGGTPIKMAETTLFITNSAREAILAPINGKKYFCYDTGKMWVYYNGWICLNPDGPTSTVYDSTKHILTMVDKNGNQVGDGVLIASDTPL